ncbi:MAG: hypothetical protein C4576_34410 [Desulfobacteraceae bacterium]|nr:MAG: hypothetical protein C4576_34410 [Desulfobacteraceae bacterium]
MPITGGVKFSLNIVPIVSAYAAPSCYIIWVGGGVVTIAHFDSNKISDQIPVVMIVPDKDIYRYACGTKIFAPGSAETTLPLPWIYKLAVSTGSDI